MHFGGLLSFTAGGTIILLAILNILHNYSQNGPTVWQLTGIFGALGFLLLGYGLFANIEYTKSKKQQ